MILFERIGLGYTTGAQSRDAAVWRRKVEKVAEVAEFYGARIVVIGRPECVFPDPPKRGRKKIVKAETEL